MKKYYPEGFLMEKKHNKKAMESISNLRECFLEGRILEAKAILCDKEHDLHVDLGIIKGIIPREECAIGISDGSVRDIAIISRVNKPVSFKIVDFMDDKNGNLVAILSRKAAQLECIEEYLKTLVPGDVINARVTHNEAFGSFCDIGCGVSALLPIDSISVSRIPHPKARLSVNMTIKAVVKSIDEMDRVTLSLKELLGTWQENADKFKAGQTVGGIVRSIEKYGIFIELTPNLAGLAEYTSNVQEGDLATVYIKSINPEKMKVKLSIIDSFPNDSAIEMLEYFNNEGHIEYWQYSPSISEKNISTIFKKNV